MKINLIWLVGCIPLINCRANPADGEHPPVKIPDFGRVIGSRESSLVSTVDMEFDSIDGTFLSNHIASNLSSRWKPIDQNKHGKWVCSENVLAVAVKGCTASYAFFSEDSKWRLFVKASASDSLGRGLKWAQFAVSSVKTVE